MANEYGRIEPAPKTSGRGIARRSELDRVIQYVNEQRMVPGHGQNFPTTRPSDVVVLRIDDDAPHAGQYEGTRIQGNLTLDGTDAAGTHLVLTGFSDADPKILVTNMSELGSDKHQLPHGSYWIGFKCGTVPESTGSPGPYDGWTEVVIAAGAVPVGQYQGQVYIMTTDDTGAMSFPFAVDPP